MGLHAIVRAAARTLQLSSDLPIDHTESMRFTRLVILVGLPVMVVTLAGCGRDGLVSPSFDLDDAPQLAPTQPEREAYNITLWLSRQLTAPPALYERIRSDLRIIRESQRDLVPEVELRFHEPWEPGRLVVGFDDWTYELISSERYHGWDSLNLLNNVERVDLSAPAFHILKIQFADPLNPERLAESYAQLPGVRFAVPNYYLGDQPMLLPAEPDQRLVYFFRNAWGDCTAGCLYSEYWVYTVISGRVVFDGYYADTALMPDDLQTGLAAAWDAYR